MPLENACFISYRHCENSLGKSIVEQFYQALCGELELLTEKKIFIDKDRLGGGYFYNEELAKNLCQSVCLILLFIPIYFSQKNTYCAREYRAMVELEKKRLAQLNPEERNHGLIIPVIFRGEDSLPAEIKSKRHYYDFSDFSLAKRRIEKDPYFASEVKKIAKYIHERCEKLNSIDPEILQECEEYSLPTDDDITPWLNEIASGPAPFPGKEE